MSRYELTEDDVLSSWKSSKTSKDFEFISVTHVNFTRLRLCHCSTEDGCNSRTTGWVPSLTSNVTEKIFYKVGNKSIELEVTKDYYRTPVTRMDTAIRMHDQAQNFLISDAWIQNHWRTTTIFMTPPQKFVPIQLTAVSQVIGFAATVQTFVPMKQSSLWLVPLILRFSQLRSTEILWYIHIFNWVSP